MHISLNVLLTSPVKRNMLANLFALGVNFLSQILLVPIFLVNLGGELYSDWIVISALTVIFSMSDIGLNTVIQNKFSMNLAEKKTKECENLLVSDYFIVSIAFILSAIVCVGYLFLFDISKQISLHVINRQEASFILIALMLGVFIKMYSSVENAIYRATHKAEICVYIDSIAKLAIVFITVIFVSLHFSLVWLAFAMIVPDIIAMIIKHFNSRHYFDYKISYNNVDLKLIKRLLFPSLIFMSFPLGNAIILQGFTLVVNKYFGANSVVLFNTTRTMCNFVKSLLGTVQNSVWPEYSIAYGLKDYARIRILLFKSLIISTIIIIVVSSLLMICGPLIYRIWTHDAIMFSSSLMIAFLIVLFFNGQWLTGSIVLLATNQHYFLGGLYIILSSVSILVGIIMLKWYNVLEVLVYSMLVADVILVGYVAYSVYKFINNMCALNK